jgi:(p)ppGpp synthase/HD superfamily hydrolase
MGAARPLMPEAGAPRPADAGGEAAARPADLTPGAPAGDAGLRAEAMARRIARAAERAGLAEAERSLLDRAFRLAMEPRRRRLADDHDPDFLHPGRTVLILLEDVGCRDPLILAAAAVCETLRPELAAPAAAIRDALGLAVHSLVAGVPVPDFAGDELLEQLVVGDHAARLIALAERLDHARHLHLRPQAEWAAFHGVTCEVYLPVALRTDPTLARRFRWWSAMFERRYLG